MEREMLAMREAEMAAEEAKLTEERERQAQSTIQQYIGLIQDKVQRNWSKPTNAKPGLSCEVFVQLIPSGDVLNVKITKSSGDEFFDRSVETAVRKAQPLPVPPDPSLFERFRDVRFIFKPEE
jgi:colicin import membrane protein